MWPDCFESGGLAAIFVMKTQRQESVAIITGSGAGLWLKRTGLVAEGEFVAVGERSPSSGTPAAHRDRNRLHRLLETLSRGGFLVWQIGRWNRYAPDRLNRTQGAQR